jgi:hypothetical protein
MVECYVVVSTNDETKSGGGDERNVDSGNDDNC